MLVYWQVIYRHTLDPIIFEFGPLVMRWYGLMYVFGFIACFFLFRKLSRERILKLNYAQIDTLLLYGFFLLFIGARLVYILVYNLPYYIEHPMDLLAIWKGGLSFHGAFLGVILAIYWVAKKFRISFWNIADAVCMSSTIGLALGRLGNFINGELYGRPTDGTWGVIFPGGGASPRHPSQLYESLTEGVLIFLILYPLRGRLKEGRVSCLFAILYGSFRFTVEFFREPDTQLGFILFNLSMGQILCLLMIVTGLFFWRKTRTLRTLKSD